MGNATSHVHYRVFRWETPSSTQHTLVFWSPTSTIHVLLKPLPKVAHTDSWWTTIPKNKRQRSNERGSSNAPKTNHQLKSRNFWANIQALPNLSNKYFNKEVNWINFVSEKEILISTEYQTYLRNPSSLGSYSLILSHAAYYKYQELTRYTYNTKKNKGKTLNN